MNIINEFKKYDIDERWLHRYLNFIEYFKIDIDKEGEVHHIIPSSVNKKIKNLNKNKWNGVKLSYRGHYIAHYILTNVFTDENKYKMLYAFNMMGRICDNSSILYKYKRKQIQDLIGESNSNRISCFKGDKIKRVKSIDEIPEGYEIGTPEGYRDFSKGHFACTDIDGNMYYVTKDDDRYKSGEIFSYRTGYKHKNSTKNLISENGIKNRTCYNDGDRNYFFKEGEEIPEGYIKGAIINHDGSHVRDTSFYHNPITKHNIRVKDGEEIPEGYIKGRIFENKGFDKINDKNLIRVFDIIDFKIMHVRKDCMLKNHSLSTIDNRYNVYKVKDKYFSSVNAISEYFGISVGFFHNCLKNGDILCVDKKSINKNVKRLLNEHTFLKDIIQKIDLRDLKEEERYNIELINRRINV